MKKQTYSSPQLKMLTMATQQTVMVDSTDDVPTIGSEDLDIDFNEPTPGNPEDAF